MNIMKEREDVMMALNNWFMSQDIHMKDAMMICAMYSGSIAGIATKNRELLTGLKADLCEMLKLTAEEWFEIAKRRDGESAP